MPGGFHMVQQQAHQNGVSSQQQMMGSHPMNASHPGMTKPLCCELNLEPAGSQPNPKNATHHPGMMTGGGAGIVSSGALYTHTHTHIYLYLYIYICTYVYTYIYTYMYIYMYIYIYIYMYIYI